MIEIQTRKTSKPALPAVEFIWTKYSKFVLFFNSTVREFQLETSNARPAVRFSPAACASRRETNDSLYTAVAARRVARVAAPSPAKVFADRRRDVGDEEIDSLPLQ